MPVVIGRVSVLSPYIFGYKGSGQRLVVLQSISNICGCRSGTCGTGTGAKAIFLSVLVLRCCRLMLGKLLNSKVSPAEVLSLRVYLLRWQALHAYDDLGKLL